MAMARDFADWYRAASVVPPADTLEKRGAGVAQATTALTRGHVIDLVRLFVQRPQTGYQAPDYLDTAFRDHDAAFPAKGNIEELRVLAGAILRNAIEEEHATALAVAYGIVSAAVGSRYADLSNQDHVAFAHRFLAERAISVVEHHHRRPRLKLV